METSPDATDGFEAMADLYSELFGPGRIDEGKLEEIIEELMKAEETSPRNENRKRRPYDPDEEWEDEEEEDVQDYAEAFKQRVINYLLAGGTGRIAEDEVNIEYTFSEKLERPETKKHEVNYSHEERHEMTNIEYDNPVFFNNQWTYQRLFIDNNGDKETVYGLTMKSMLNNGTEVEVRHDGKFNTAYVSSIDGKADGSVDPETGKRKYWEFWIIDKETGNERIGEESVYQQEVKRKEMIEWRLATEQESGCGGGITSDPLILQNDPTIDKSRLPAYMQSAFSVLNGYNSRKLGYSGSPLGAS